MRAHPKLLLDCNYLRLSVAFHSFTVINNMGLVSKPRAYIRDCSVIVLSRYPHH